MVLLIAAVAITAILTAVVRHVYRKRLEPMEVVFPPKPYIRRVWERIPHHDMWYEDFVKEFAGATRPGLYQDAFQLMLDRQLDQAAALGRAYKRGRK